MIKVGIGIPTAGSIKADMAYALFRAMIRLYKADILFSLLFTQGSYIHTNRERLVKKAQSEGCTHILFVDDDMFFEADAPQRLLARDKDIIGVHYNIRKNPPTSTVRMDAEKKAHIAEVAPDGLTTCDAAGTGFMLIKLSVFDKLSHPWFFYECDNEGELRTSEDYWFCKKAKDAGFEIWVDLTIPVKHIGDHKY